MEQDMNNTMYIHDPKYKFVYVLQMEKPRESSEFLSVPNLENYDSREMAISISECTMSVYIEYTFRALGSIYADVRAQVDAT